MRRHDRGAALQDRRRQERGRVTVNVYEVVLARGAQKGPRSHRKAGRRANRAARLGQDRADLAPALHLREELEVGLAPAPRMREDMEDRPARRRQRSSRARSCITRGWRSAGKRRSAP